MKTEQQQVENAIMATIHTNDPTCPVCKSPTIRSYSFVAIGGIVIHCDRCQLSVPLASLVRATRLGEIEQ